MTNLKFEPINVYDGQSLRDATESHSKSVPLEKVRVKKTTSVADNQKGSWKMEPFLASVLVNRGNVKGKVLEPVEMLVTCPELNIHEPYATELDIPEDLKQGRIDLLVSLDCLIEKSNLVGTLTLELKCGENKLPIKQLPVEFIESE